MGAGQCNAGVLGEGRATSHRLPNAIRGSKETPRRTRRSCPLLQRREAPAESNSKKFLLIGGRARRQGEGAWGCVSHCHVNIPRGQGGCEADLNLPHLRPPQFLRVSSCCEHRGSGLCLLATSLAPWPRSGNLRSCLSPRNPDRLLPRSWRTSRPLPAFRREVSSSIAFPW